MCPTSTYNLYSRPTHANSVPSRRWKTSTSTNKQWRQLSASVTLIFRINSTFLRMVIVKESRGENIGNYTAYHASPVWGSQLTSIGRLPRWPIAERSLDIEGTGEIKYPGRIWKLIYDGLPRGNKDLGLRSNCKWEAALAKLTVGGEECNRYSYRSETDRRRWEPSWRLSHCDVEGKEKPAHYDLKAATKVITTKPSGTKFSGDKIVPQSDLRVGQHKIESSRKKSIESQHGM